MKYPQSILITGASSGIGAALARAYANPGVTLAISGRNAGRLAEVAGTCRTLGAEVLPQIVDVVDPVAMANWIDEIDTRRPLDLVIANAGVSYGFSADDKDDKISVHTRKTFDVNVHGVFNTVHPALEKMRERHRGQIAIMSSLAGFHGLPGAPAYSTSKVAVRAYGEALRGLYKPEGIEVNVICPGFVESEMTANNRFPMPFLMTAPRAARIIRRGLAANRGRIAFPLPMVAATRLMSLLPECWLERLLEAAPGK